MTTEPERMVVAAGFIGCVHQHWYDAFYNWYNLRYGSRQRRLLHSGNVPTSAIGSTLGCTTQEAEALLAEFMASRDAWSTAGANGVGTALVDMLAVAPVRFELLAAHDPSWMRQTKDWVGQVCGPRAFSSILWTDGMVDRGRPMTIGQICRARHVSVIIHDQPDVIEEVVRDAGAVGILMGQNRWTLDGHGLTNHHRIYSALSWAGVARVFTEITARHRVQHGRLGPRRR